MRRGIKKPLLALAALALLACPVTAFKPAIHQAIITAAFADPSLNRIDPGSGNVLQFTSQAISDVSTANYQTDCGTGSGCTCYSCQTDSSRHFDNEDFSDATARLITLKQQILALITSSTPDGGSAGTALGQALHTVQDFYSHSDWIEAGGSSIDSRLGVSTYAGLPLNVAVSTGDPGVLDTHR